MTDTTTKKAAKKELRKAVYEKLAGALAEYKDDFSKKKFESRLKKASKLFAVDIAKATRRNKKETIKKNGIRVE